MEKKTNKNWLFLAINGVISMLFGALLVFFTEMVIQSILMWAGIILLAAGVVLFLLAIRQLQHDKNVAMLILQSVASIALGLIMLIFRERTLEFLLIVIGVWAVVVGVFQLVVLVNVPKALKGRNFLLFNGILTMGLGIFLIVKPLEFAQTAVTVVGVLAMIFGVGMIVLSVLIRKVLLEKAGVPEVPSDF